MTKCPSIFDGNIFALDETRFTQAWNAANKCLELSGERPLMKPMTGIVGCCARAASGHIAAEPNINLINSRRRIAFPEAQEGASYWIKQQL